MRPATRWIWPLPARAVAAALFCLVVVPAAAALPVKPVQLVRKADAYAITIVAPHTGIEAIDDQLVAWAKKAADDFAATTTRDRQPEEEAYSLDMHYTVMRNDAAMFEVLFESNVDTGGAHPNLELESFVFLLPDGHRVYFPEIVGASGVAVVSRLAIEGLIRELPDADQGEIRKGAAPDPANFRVFAITKDALVLYFAPYQVAGFAGGAVTIKIPLDKLAGVIRADWRAPQPSFDCTRAATDIDRTICSDVALARLDREMAAAYRLWLRWFPDNPAKLAAQREDQRAWLAARATQCRSAPGPHDGGVPGADFIANGLRCMKKPPPI